MGPTRCIKWYLVPFVIAVNAFNGLEYAGADLNYVNSPFLAERDAGIVIDPSAISNSIPEEFAGDSQQAMLDIPSIPLPPHRRQVPDSSFTGPTSSVAAPISTTIPDDGIVRYVLNTNQNHIYEIIANGSQVFATANICQQPDNSFNGPFIRLSDQLSDLTNVTESSYDVEFFLGFANITVNTTGSGKPYYLQIVAPQDSGDSDDLSTWTYELGLSDVQPLHSFINDTNLYLVDTDFSHGLFITDILPELVGNVSWTNTSVAAEFDFYVYNDPGLNDLAFSYCAASTGPALLAEGNTVISITTQGLNGSSAAHYFVNGLNTSTDYVAYLTDPNSRAIYGGVNFSSKAETNCQIVYDLEFCADVAFAVPGNASAYTSETLGAYYDSMAETFYENFTYSLQQIDCSASSEARYSILRDCDDCDNSYKRWLCATVIPRCTDYSNKASFLRARDIGNSRVDFINEVIMPGPYKEILPCADMCYSIMQDCHPSFGFQCPLKGFGLEDSYGQRSENGDVTCSYPGAVYYASGAQMLMSPMLLASVAFMFVFIWL